MQTNNILYEKKHRYMLILKEINILYNQTNTEVLNNEIPAFKAKQIKDMYNQTLIGLIEEGVKYQYIKDSKNSAKDIISITIDGLNYRCKNTDLKDILGDRYKDVMGIEYKGPNRKNVEKNENDYKIPEMPKDVSNSNIQSFIPPKVYISPENDFSKKKKTNIFSIIRQVFITAVVIAACVGGFVYVLGENSRREAIINGWNNCVDYIKSSFNKNDYIDVNDIQQEADRLGDPASWTDVNSINE